MVVNLKDLKNLSNKIKSNELPQTSTPFLYSVTGDGIKNTLSPRIGFISSLSAESPTVSQTSSLTPVLRKTLQEPIPVALNVSGQPSVVNTENYFNNISVVQIIETVEDKGVATVGDIPFGPRIGLNSASAPLQTSGASSLSRQLEENPLRNFNTYNYIFTLGIVAFDKLARPLARDFEFDSILIRSGGGQLDKRVRTADEESGIAELFIDNIEIESLVSPNSRTGNTFGTHVSFDVLEPYSMGKFIESIVVGISELSATKDIKSVPLVLKIEFVGWDDNNGDGGVDIPPYIIPIMITQVDFTVDSSGAKYSVSAVPYIELALGDEQLKIKNDISLPATSVAGMMSELANHLNKQFSDDGTNDNVIIELDPVFKNATVSQADILNEGNVDENGIPVAQYTSGRSVIAIINDIITSSSIYDQELASSSNNDQPATPEGKTYHMVVPEVIPSAVDGTVIKTIKYKIIKYVHPATQLTNLNSLPEFYKRSIKKVVKEYNYIYTGKNEDILSLDLKLNTAYYKTVLSNFSNLQDGLGGRVIANQSNEPIGIRKNTTTPPPTDANEFGTTVVPLQKNNSVTLGGDGVNNNKRRLAKYVFDAMTNDTVDLITVDMEIWGDPYYLPTVVSNALTAETADRYIDSNGRMPYLTEPACVLLNFKTPFDYPVGGSSTIDMPSTKTVGEFSGLYRVISVTSSFTSGQYKQNLQMIRLTGQNYADDQSGKDLIQALGITWQQLLNGIIDFFKNLFSTIRDTFDDVTDSIFDFLQPSSSNVSGNQSITLRPNSLIVDQSGSEISQMSILSGARIGPSSLASSLQPPRVLTYSSVSVNNNLLSSSDALNNYNIAKKQPSKVFEYPYQETGNNLTINSSVSTNRPLAQTIPTNPAASIRRPPVR